MPTQCISSAQLQSHASQEDWDSVIEFCQLIMSAQARTDASKADCCALLGRAWREKKDDAAAIAAYTESLKQQPNQPDSNYALGLLYARQKRYSRAICHYQAALLQRPNWAEAAYRLGNVLCRLGQGDQAIKTYRQLLQHTPDHVESYLALGMLYERSGQRELAIKQFRQALFARPDHLNAYRHVGSALARMEEYAAAADVYAQALVRFPENALMHGNLGQMKLIQGDTAAAMAAYHQSLSLDPKLSLTHHNLGLLWRSHQNLDQAAGYFRQALMLDPNSTAVLGSYADVLLSQGDWPTLFDCFRRAIAHQPDWIEAYCQKALQLFEQDLLLRVQKNCGRFLMELQQAESAATAAILPVQLCELCKHMGAFSMACHAPDRAEQCYRLAIALNPHELETYSELGQALMQQGRRAAAIAIYQAGILQHQTAAAGTAIACETLRSQLENALLSNLAAHHHEIAGIYHHTQDWLAARPENAGIFGSISGPISGPIPVPTEAQPNPKCGGVTCQLCMGNLMRKFSPAQVGQQAYHCRPESDASDLPFPTFTASIPAGRAWIAPQNSAWDVCDEIAIFTPDSYLLGDLSRAFPWYLPGCQRHDIASHPALHRLTPLPKVRYIAGKVAVLSALSGHIYYHWMFDVLPRLNVLQQALHRQGQTLCDIDYFVVNSLAKDFQKETLRALGIPLAKVIASDQHPHIQADQLVVPSFAGHLDWVPPNSIDFLRETFLTSASPPNSQQNGQRLYISRSKAKYRHIFNEAAVIEMLSRFGFVTVALETLSVTEQAKLFAQAEVVIAPHGSGLTNLTFCSPGTTVIECFSPHYMRTDYWMISQYLQLNHYYLVGEGFTCYPLRQLMYPSGLTEDFLIDVRALRSLLKTVGLNPL